MRKAFLIGKLSIYILGGITGSTACVAYAQTRASEPLSQGFQLILTRSLQTEIKTSKTQPHGASATAPDALKLTLDQAVKLALSQGSAMRNASLDVATSRISNDAAYNIYRPKFLLGSTLSKDIASISGAASSTTSSASNPNGAAASVNFNTSIKTATGATLTLGLDRAYAFNGLTSGNAIGSVQINQPLWRGASFLSASPDIKQILLSNVVSEISFQQAKQALVTDIFSAYYSVYAAEQALQIADRSLKRAVDTLEVNELLFNSGRIAKLDQLQAQANISQTRLNRKQAEQANEEVQRVLAIKLGLPTETKFELPAVTDQTIQSTISLEAARKLALTNRLEIKSADLAQEIAELNLEKATDNLSPKIDLFVKASSKVGALSSGATDIPGSKAFGILLEIPLDDRDGKAARDLAALALTKSKYAREDIVISVVTEVDRSYKALVFTQESQDVVRDLLLLQQARLDAELTKLKIGRSTNNQVSDAQDTLRDAERTVLNLKLEAIKRKFEFDLAIGTAL